MSIRREDGTAWGEEQYATVGVDAVDFERYGHIRLDDDEMIVYDTENDEAWLQSGATVDLAAML
jgi:hypothetical protein